MERRRKYSRHFLQTMQTLPVLLVVPLSILLVICSLVNYAECIMSFPEGSGVYSLFPDEDLKTGRKRFRFDDETTRSYRDRDGRADYSSVRSYPMLPHDRLHRPVDYSSGGGSRQVYDNYRNRQSRVYFDEHFRNNRFDYHRLTPRPRPIERPVSPIIFETSRPHHHHFLPDGFPPPAVGQSKLPAGAASRASGEDVPTRIHVFNPESNNFGNPRNAGGGGNGGTSAGEGTSSERVKGPPSNFVETGPPGPESFLNHEEFLEYQKKIAFARFHEQDGSSHGGSGSSSNAGSNGKKILFESKEPFEIDGLVPPDKSGENSGKLSTTSQVPLQHQHPQTHGQLQRTGKQQDHPHQHSQQQPEQYDQRQLQREEGEGQPVRTSGAPNHRHQHRHHVDNDREEERDSGGGEVESDTNGRGEEVESENGKSEVTQLPPTHITKSGRAHGGSSNSDGDGSSASAHSRFTPSISYNDGQVGGTGFKLPTTAVSYSDDEPPNLNGFLPVVPFHLIGAEQPRTINLERQRQQQQHRIIPHAPEHSTTTTRTTTAATSTVRSIPVTTPSPKTTTARAKAEKSGFRTPEVTKSTSSSSSSGTDENASSRSSSRSSGDVVTVNKTTGFSSPASPILHATAGERINSETHNKVAITKQQELKRLQKQRQLNLGMHQLTRPHPGLFPDFGFGDSSSSDSADISDNHNPGIHDTNMNNNNILDDTPGKTYSPQDPIIPIEDIQSSPSLPTDFDTPTSPVHQLHSSEHDKDTNSKHLPSYDTENTLGNHHTHIQSHFHKASSKKQKNITRHKIHKEGKLLHNIEQNEHSSVTKGDETIKSTSVDDTNNEIFDTQAVKTANGIKQGEFYLEGYMVNGNNGGGNSDSSLSSRSSISLVPDYENNHNAENDDNQQNYHRHQYDYPNPDENMPRVGTSHLMPDNPLSPVISQLPGTTTPDLQPENEYDLTPSSVMNTTPYQSLLNNITSNADHDNSDDVTGNEYFSRSSEPTEVNGSDATVGIKGDSKDAFESEPTLPDQELHRTRLSEISENSFVPTNPSTNVNDEDNFGLPFVNYGYSNNDNINSRSSSSGSTNPNNSSGSSSSTAIDEDVGHSGSSRSNEYLDENGAFEHDDFHRLGKSFRYGSYINGRKKSMKKIGRKPSKMSILDVEDSNSIIPPSVSIPVQATLTTGLNVPNLSSSGFSSSNLDVSNSFGLDGSADYSQNHFNSAPLYLESSETLINQTYYLNENNYNHSKPIKSSNFIKVTRIKAPPPSGTTSSSKETAEKTSSTILARRTSKQAVIVSEVAAGSRPKVVGSVVEAGPAWPGLVNTFLKHNYNRSFTATATVRPRGNIGTNPTHPTSVINGQVLQQLKQQQRPTQFNLPLAQISQPTVITANDASKHVDIKINVPKPNHSPASNSSKSSHVNIAKVVKLISSSVASNIGNDTNAKTDTLARRLYSSEETSSSAQIRSNSSTGVVSMVHAHISHCPKLHSPTEVICDVHIRQGHGIPNPQLTVGWRRKFYNSTQPDILLAVNKTPASGENGRFDPHHSIVELEEGKDERLEEFHDKFNVTLAPGISPMLRSVLLIRSVTAPDCGTYQCEVNDGINVLKSETLLFLCH